MKPSHAIAALLTLLLTIPMWLFMTHEILVAIHADRLLWFIYWAYVPLTIIASIINAIVQGAKK